MHIRNKHKEGYDFKALKKALPELAPYVKMNPYNPSLGETIDFSNPQAVKLLNKALLKLYYGVLYWDLPKEALCPPIPGRADYIHTLTELVTKTGPQVRVLDIGTGANCVYPLIGQSEYGWSFVGSEIDKGSFQNAQKILDGNPQLKGLIELRLQKKRENIFIGVIGEKEFFDLSLCNPPFHASASAASEGSMRKCKNLGLKKTQLNFGGKNHELWCEGGEKAFLLKMIEESALYKNQVQWFTSLVSKGENLPALKAALKKQNVSKLKVLEMSQGQKISRLLAWSYR